MASTLFPSPTSRCTSLPGWFPPPRLETEISGPLSGTYYFAVPTSLTTAQLDVQAAAVSAVEYPGPVGANGKLTELELVPTTIDLARLPAPKTTQRAPTPTSAPTSSPGRHPRFSSRGGDLSLPGAIALGGGGGGVLLLVVVVPIFIRRRRYDRADREGRVVIESPPVLVRATLPLPAPEAGAVQERAPPGGVVEVAVLGQLEFRGLLHPTASAPVLELLCYLALHPRRSFTAAELRNAIWAEPRTEPTAQSFHNYVSKLRKALPQGALVRSEYRYRLCDVDSDWGAFLAHTGEVDAALVPPASRPGPRSGAPLQRCRGQRPLRLQLGEHRVHPRHGTGYRGRHP